MDKEKCKALAAIIGNYRSGEIEQLNTEHVEKWIGQFDEQVQDPILEEMIYVFSEWYLTRDYIVNEYLDKIPEILQKKYGFSSEYETCQAVSFVDVQSAGQSQKKLISELKRLKQEQYGIVILTDIDSSISHYAYVDDGLYSGSRFRKDLREIAYQMKPGDTLDVFYLAVCMSGASYATKEVKEMEEALKIDIKFHPMKRIYNDRKVHINSKGDEIWWNDQMCLWPSLVEKSDPEIGAFYDFLKTLGTNYEKYPYRTYRWADDPGIFSNKERRTLVEHEFLKKGIQIYKDYQGDKKGMYPLGYNLWPSFGFGVLFATDFNVPNNAPMVIWADTNWYPLLPRRSNNQGGLFDADDDYDIEYGYSCDSTYNICPDCGKLFGIDEDGGNGFCIDCAWNH